MMSEASSQKPSHQLSEEIIICEDVNKWFGDFHVLKNISVRVRRQEVVVIIGPSGSGKSTFIRTINRLEHHQRGTIVVDGIELTNDIRNIATIRSEIGMVFQQPNPFPTMSIHDNVAAPARFNGLIRNKSAETDLVERCLRQAALWEEVKDKLKAGGTSLSGGQQQRLCIARALALEPDVLLMDEPCSALDPIATLQVENLMVELKREYTIIIVTHNMQQAARVSDYTAMMMIDDERAGHVIEFDETHIIFTNPKDKRTEDYVTGRFG